MLPLFLVTRNKCSVSSAFSCESTYSLASSTTSVFFFVDFTFAQYIKYSDQRPDANVSHSLSIVLYFHGHYDAISYPTPKSKNSGDKASPFFK
jgi:hypothetical protein